VNPGCRGGILTINNKKVYLGKYSSIESM